MVDEAAYLPDNQALECKETVERYIGKVPGFRLALISTPSSPNSVFEQLGNEPQSTCIYKQIRLHYTVGLGKVYNDAEISKAKLSRSFEREYCLKATGIEGDLFSPAVLDRIIAAGNTYNPDEVDTRYWYSLGYDPGHGSSKFGVCLCRLKNGRIEVMIVDQFERVNITDILTYLAAIIKQYRNVVTLMDSSTPAITESLRKIFGLPTNYNDHIDDLWQRGFRQKHDLIKHAKIKSISFAKEGRWMLSHLLAIADELRGLLAVNSRFTDLIMALRTATATEYSLNKDSMIGDDIFDALRLACYPFDHHPVNAATSSNYKAAIA